MVNLIILYFAITNVKDRDKRNDNGIIMVWNDNDIISFLFCFLQ